MSWKDYVNIYTIAGAGAGAYAGHAKYGKDHGYKAPLVGAGLGILAGILVEKLIAPRAVAPQVVAAPQPAQVQQQAGQGEYVDLDGGMGEFVTPPQPPRPGASPTQQAEYEAAHAAFENLGSLSGADGLGSLSGTPGFDADSIDYDEILGEDGGSDFN